MAHRKLFRSSTHCSYPYNVFRRDRLTRTGGGCVILAHHSLRVREVTYPQALNFNDIQIVGIEIYNSGLVHVITCLYNPPGMSASTC